MTSRTLLVVVLTGLAPSAVLSAQTLDQRPMVAFLGPLSGEYEAIGSRAWASVSMATTQMGVARAEMFDTADDPAGAYALARAAGAIAILGPIGELESRVVSEAADPDGPPVFLLTSVQGLESGRPHVFRMRTSAADQAEALLAYHLATGEMSSFAILAPDDSYGEEAVLAAIRSVPEFGGVVDRVVRYETDDPDASDAVAQLVGQRAQRLAVPANPWRTPPSISIRSSGGDRSRPDAVFIPDFAPQVASILPHLAFHEWLDTGGAGRVRLLGLSGWASVALEAVGDLAATARVTQIFSVEDFRGLSESFSLEYQVRFGDEPTEFDAQVFDAASFVLSMLAARPDSLQRAVLELDSFGGICGDAWFDAEGGLVRTIGLWEVDGLGQLYPIDVIRPPREGALR